jgi:hypothetical protein
MSVLGRLFLSAAVVAIAAVPAALGAPGDQTFTVSSSLDGKKVLPLRSHWLGYTSLPPAQVDRVEFLIDGKVRWVEHQAPYNYAADDNGRNMGYLVTTWLKPGLHQFVVRVYDKAGNSQTDGVTARVVAAPAPPPELAGTWTRIQPSTSKHFKGWRFTLWLDRTGVWYFPVPPSGRTCCAGGGGFVDQYDVRGHTLNVYGTVVMGVQDVVKGDCKGNGCVHRRHGGRVYLFSGFVCNFSGPFGSYRWSVSGSTLSVKPIHDGCSGRTEMLAGTWTRAG